MKKIGISTSNLKEGAFTLSRLSGSNVDAVRKAGGLPIFLPSSKDPALAREYIARVDGLVLTGGEDVAPFLYGEDPNTEERYDFERDAFELELFKAAMDKGIPILAICRGLQLVNVARGGSNIRDLKLAGYESTIHAITGAKWQEPTDLYHFIEVEEDSKLYQITGKKELVVNSIHHQALDQLGENMVAVARSRDGIIEAAEMTDYPAFIGLQFHPERLQDQEEMRNIYKDFIGRA